MHQLEETKNIMHHRDQMSQQTFINKERQKHGLICMPLAQKLTK